MVRLLGKVAFWGVVYAALWYGLAVTLGLSVHALLPLVVTIGFAVFWSKVVGPWWSRDTEAQRQRNRARNQAERDAAHARMAALDQALTESRQVPRIAFDAETQRAHGMPMYHTHYVSPEMQRHLEEWYVDDEPSLKAGVYVTPVKVTGPELIDAPPKEKPFFIPVSRPVSSD